MLDSGEAFRHLGVMVSLHGSQKAQIKELVALSHEFVRLLRPKIITDKITGFLYKVVFLSKLVFKASELCVTNSEAEDMERPLRVLLKNKSGLPVSMTNSLLFSTAGYDLPKISDALDMQEITNMLVWLNSTGIVGTSPGYSSKSYRST